MNNFKDFGIKQEMKGFTGDKISVFDVLNREIIIEDWKEEVSKFEGKGMRLDLQIKFQGKQRVLWLSSKCLLETIKQVPRDKFPFATTIIQENKRFQFT